MLSDGLFMPDVYSASADGLREQTLSMYHATQEQLVLGGNSGSERRIVVDISSSVWMEYQASVQIGGSMAFAG
jgi:hypothetical protein